VSDADSILFGRAELEQAFTALGERLVRRGVVADIFIVGGAAMALAYDAARVTRDVDAMFKPHGIVHEEAMQVANDLGLPRWWLNEQASTYISGKEDADKRRVFDHPGLNRQPGRAHGITSSSSQSPLADRPLPRQAVIVIYHGNRKLTGIRSASSIG
jgi:hypothetical protein